MRTFHTLCVFTALTFAAPPMAAAQPGEGGVEEGGEGARPEGEGTHPENVEATREARTHFMRGLEHFREHRYREAIQSFRLAMQLVPSADLHYNIARAHEELAQYDAAIEHYQSYLRDRVDPPDRERIEAHIERLREQAEAARQREREQPSTGTLRLTANRSGATIALDGDEVGTSPWEETRELSAGRHSLTLTRDGFVPFRSEVSVEAGVPTAAYADLVPETRYRAIHADRIFTWIVWGLGVAALGTAIGLGVEASSRQDTDLDDARTWAAYSDVFLGSAVGLGIVGLILWFVEGRTVGTERITVEAEDASDIRGP